MISNLKYNKILWILVSFLTLTAALTGVFNPLWISQLLPLIQEGRRIESMYSVFILDMCFILPAFVIITIMTVKAKGLGLLLTPTLFINGFALLFSVALGGILKPLYNQAANAGEIWLYLGLSITFLLLTLLYFRNLNIEA
jgi:hypothetical protein